jgi:hypothetical protein
VRRSGRLKLDANVIPAGTVIHWQGLPFFLCENTRVLGDDGNFRTAEDAEHDSYKRDEAKAK